MGFKSSWAWIGQFVFRLKCNNYVNFCNFFVLFVQNLWEISYFFGIKKLCNIFDFSCYLLQGFLECSTIIHFDSVFTYFWYNASRMKKTEQITFFFHAIYYLDMWECFELKCFRWLHVIKARYIHYSYLFVSPSLVKKCHCYVIYRYPIKRRF